MFLSVTNKEKSAMTSVREQLEKMTDLDWRGSVMLRMPASLKGTFALGSVTRAVCRLMTAASCVESSMVCRHREVPPHSVRVVSASPRARELLRTELSETAPWALEMLCVLLHGASTAESRSSLSNRIDIFVECLASAHAIAYDLLLVPIQDYAFIDRMKLDQLLAEAVPSGTAAPSSDNSGSSDSSGADGDWFVPIAPPDGFWPSAGLPCAALRGVEAIHSRNPVQALHALSAYVVCLGADRIGTDDVVWRAAQLFLNCAKLVPARELARIMGSAWTTMRTPAMGLARGRLGAVPPPTLCAVRLGVAHFVLTEKRVAALLFKEGGQYERMQPVLLSAISFSSAVWERDVDISGTSKDEMEKILWERAASIYASAVARDGNQDLDSWLRDLIGGGRRHAARQQQRNESNTEDAEVPHCCVCFGDHGTDARLQVLDCTSVADHIVCIDCWGRITKNASAGGSVDCMALCPLCRQACKPRHLLTPN